MADVRRIKKVWKAKPTIEGAGVHLKRVFGYHEVPQLDPFLLLDDFRSNDPAEYVRGFPWHPHRGIETITYVLAGDVEHGDSLGNRGVISSGDVQWVDRKSTRLNSSHSYISDAVFCFKKKKKTKRPDLIEHPTNSSASLSTPKRSHVCGQLTAACDHQLTHSPATCVLYSCPLGSITAH